MLTAAQIAMLLGLPYCDVAAAVSRGCAVRDRRISPTLARLLLIAYYQRQVDAMERNAQDHKTVPPGMARRMEVKRQALRTVQCWNPAA